MLSSSRFCEWNGHRPARTVVGVLTTNECDRETCKDFSQTETKSENQVCGWHFGVVGRGQEDKKVQTTKKCCCLVDRRWQTGEWNNNNNRSVIFFSRGGGVRLAGRLDGNWLGHWVLVSFLTPSSLGSSPSFSFFPTFWPPGGGCWPRTHTVQKKKNKNIWIQVGPHTQTAVTFLLLPGFFLFCFPTSTLFHSILFGCASRESGKRAKKLHSWITLAVIDSKQSPIIKIERMNKKYIESSIEMRFHSIDHVVKERERERERKGKLVARLTVNWTRPLEEKKNP